MGADWRRRVALQLFLISLFLSPAASVCDPKCKRGDGCLCATDALPEKGESRLKYSQVPRMVNFVFEGAVNAETMLLIRNIFPVHPNVTRRNPNGCPMVSTIFVQFERTDFCAVNRLWTYGNEIGTGIKGLPSTATEKVRRYAQNLKSLGDTIHDNSKIDYIYGTRLLGLQQDTDYFKAVYELEVEYDASLHVIREEKNRTAATFPFTMANGSIEAPLKCEDQNNCPTKDNDWIDVYQIPVLGVQNKTNTTVVKYVHGLFDVETANEWQINRSLADAFISHFSDKRRVPLMLNIRINDLKTPPVLNGINHFLNWIEALKKGLLDDPAFEHHLGNDIWVVTLKDVLTWILSPEHVGDLYKYAGKRGEWRCEPRMLDNCYVMGLDAKYDDVTRNNTKNRTLLSLDINNLFPEGYYLVYWQTGILIGAYFIIVIYDKYGMDK